MFTWLAIYHLGCSNSEKEFSTGSINLLSDREFSRALVQGKVVVRILQQLIKDLSGVSPVAILCLDSQDDLPNTVSLRDDSSHRSSGED